MKKLVVIKPQGDLFKDLGIKRTEFSEIKFFPAEKKIELKCLIDDSTAFGEIDIVEENLKKKFGNDLEFDFNIGLKKKETEDAAYVRIIERVIQEIRKENIAAKVYFSLFRYNLNGNELIIEVKNEIAKIKLEEFNIGQKISLKIEKYIKEKIDCSFIVGEFSKEIEQILNYHKIDDIAVKNSINTSPKKDKEGDKEKEKEKPKADSNIIYGKEIKGNSITIKEFDELYVGDDVILEGDIFHFDKMELSSGKVLLMFNITDYKDSVTCKMFVKQEDDFSIKPGTTVKIKGKKQQDKFNNAEDVIFVNYIMKAESKKAKKRDNAEVKRVELHAHTKMSEMDSVADVDELVKKAAEYGHKAVAVTDHGVLLAFPFAYKAAKKMENMKIIFGTEGYLVDDSIRMVENPKDIYLEQETYVVFDIETTGFDPHHDKIIEIGAVKLKGETVIDRFSTFINPQIPIPKHIIELTNIDDTMVKGAPLIDKVIKEFIDFIGDATLVAHNANFDVGFIKQKAKQYDLIVANSVIDTLQWSRNILKEQKRHNLKELAKYFGISLENHHRAVDDAEATASIFQKFLDILVRQGVHKLTGIDDKFETNIKNASTYHVIILVKDKVGLKNLYKITSYAHIDYYKKVPRIPKSVLEKHREGLIIGTACEAGELMQAYLKGKTDEEIEGIAGFYDYLEIQPVSNNSFMVDDGIVKTFDDLREMNRYVYNLGKKLGKPVCATGDVHYIEKEDNIYRSILLYGQGFKDFNRDSGLYFRTTQEMLDEFSYLGVDGSYEVVVTNTNLIADMIEKIKPIPDGFYPPKIENAEEECRRMTYETAHSLYGDKLPEQVEQRIERELNAIIKNGFAVLYLTAHKLVKKSLDDGYLVGSRGSVGSSIVARMMNITEVNALYPHYLCSNCHYTEFMDFEGSGVDLPDKVCPNCGSQLRKEGHSIPFEVFMGFDGDKVPDIDLNFSGEYQAKVHRYTEELFGKENVFRAGTISTLADKNAFGYVKKYVEENSLSMRKAEMERLAKGCENVRKTTGQHPGGMIVVPYDHSIYEFTPVQKPANDMTSESITTHFDYHVMDEQLVKLDILGHDDPTTIKLLQEYTNIDIYQVPLDDKKTISIFSSTEALGVTPQQIESTVGTYGIPEFGTSFVRQMLVDTLPTTFAELVRISGLSHGTDVWLNNAQEYVRQGVAKLSEVISVRDDIMNYLIDAGIEKGTSFKIMEFVRKGKPTSDKEQWAKYAELMKQHGVKQWYIYSCAKIKYMFPKGHAVAYVMMAVRIAYFKVHHPVAFYAAFLSRKADDFDAETMLIPIEGIKERKKVLDGQMKLDVKEKGEMTLLEIIIEMYYRKVEMLKVDIYKSDARKFLIEDGKLRVPLIAIAGLGETVVENIIEERTKGEFLSYEDFIRRTKATKTVVEKLKQFKVIEGISDYNQKQLF